MKKETTLREHMVIEPSLVYEVKKIVRRFHRFLQYNCLVNRIAVLYSIVMGEPLSNLNTLRIINVQIAALFLIMPCDINLLLRTIFLVWTATALWQCKKIK